MANRAKKAEKVAEVISRESVATTNLCAARLCDIDHKTGRHLYCHRESDALKFDEAPDAPMTQMIESLLMEGLQVPLEFHRDKEGRLILVRGYRRVSALHHIIERGLDPERFGAEMEVPAVEVASDDPRDLLVRSVADNEVRAGLDDGEKYLAAQQMIAAGVSAQRAARALGMSPTSFARLYRRIQYPRLQAYVDSGPLSQTDLDNLIEAAASHNRVEKLESLLAGIVTTAKEYVNRRRAQALAAGEEFDEEKEGKLKQYIKPDLVKTLVKAIRDGKEVKWAGPDQDAEDGSWTCRIDTKEGLLQIGSLKRNLYKVTAEELGKIAFRLARTAAQAEKWWQRKRAEEGLAQTTAVDEGESFADFLEKRNATAEAAKVRQAMVLAQGEADPAHGKVSPRVEVDLAGSIDVPPAHEFDPMIDS